MVSDSELVHGCLTLYVHMNPQGSLLKCGFFFFFFFGHNGSHLLHLGSLSRHVESSSWPGIKHGPPALGTWSLNHWTTKDVPMQISDSAGLGWGLKFCISIRISSRWYWGSCSADDPHSSFERQDAKPGVTIVFYSPDQVTVLPCPRLSHSILHLWF